MAIRQTENSSIRVAMKIARVHSHRISSLAHFKLFIISFNSSIAVVVRNQNLYGLDTCVITILARLPTLTHFCRGSMLGKSPSNIASRLVTAIFENSSCCWKYEMHWVTAHIEKNQHLSKRKWQKYTNVRNERQSWIVCTHFSRGKHTNVQRKPKII